MIIIDCKNKKIEACLKVYRQKVEKIKQVQELRERQTFEKPSVRRRREKLSAKYRNLKNGNTQL